MQREHADLEVGLSPQALAKAIVSQAAKDAGIAVTGEQTTKAAKAKRPKKATDQPTEVKAAEPKAARVKKAKETRPVCSKAKKDGTPCTAHSMAGVDYCTDHRPPFLHLTAEEQVVLNTALENSESRMALVVEWLGWGKAKLLAAKLGGGQ